MREEVGRSIGLSARKVQVRLCASCFLRLPLTTLLGLVPGEWRYLWLSDVRLREANHICLNYFRISARKPVVRAARVQQRLLHGLLSTALTLQHLPQRIRAALSSQQGLPTSVRSPLPSRVANIPTPIPNERPST